MIKYDDFQKLDLRVGKILSAETIEKSDKLIKLQVEVGSETRQVIAGIKSGYKPGALLNKNVIILVNLEPRMIFGHISQGMLLAADSKKPVLLKPWTKVVSGVKIQ